VAEFTPNLAKILIVDDQEHNISLLERILERAGYVNIFSTLDPHQIQQLLNDVEPDIILLDLHMPGMDGIQALNIIREQTGADNYLPVLMLTADNTTKAKQNGLQAGVNDFITKPYDRIEVVLRINNLLKTRFLHNQLQQYNSLLEERVKQRTEQLQQAKIETLELLGRASEFRDDMTGSHTQRVGHMSGLIASQIGLPEWQVELIRKAAPLHDIGKIGIPDQILLKPGRFEPDEFEQMKLHTTIGANILKDSSFDVLRTAEVIARFHHEKWDGTGYPQGMKGEEIPIEARIVAIADFYDALTHERPYKKAWTSSEAIEEAMRQSGKHFDPKVVEAFLYVINKG
jgi:putative two-component system response regulator